ncbi:MAG: glutamate---cysteine ligase / carboxylate-amine ligase [Acidimicrobiaceae bacterium]|nr:glutamate---cysteine ligase / carboxylate-amine ligase [Acidimicrobiaceae bacterium]
MSTARSLGIEEELQVIDADTFRLAFRAPQLLNRLPDKGFSAELQRSTVETNTAVCSSLDGLSREVQGLRSDVITAANHQGLAVAAAGTAPLSSAADLELTALGRYSRMQQDYRLLVDQHLVCGLQVHVEVKDADLAVRLIPWVESALPTLLALSTSSPFFEGQDTGYASVRTVIWQRWPTAGRTPRLKTYAEYQGLIQSLIDSSVISDDKMAYFDVRPSPNFPTLELRVCDSCPLVDDTILIAGLFRAAVERAIDAESTGGKRPNRSGPLYRAAMWRAARSGLSDTLIDGRPESAALPASEVVGHLVDDLRPQLEESGDWEVISELTAAAMARGSSSERQRARYAERGRVDDVVRHLLRETEGRTDGPRSRTRWSASYRVPVADEAVHPTGIPYSTYEPIFKLLEQFDPAETSIRAARARDKGLTFGVGGEQRPFPVDLVPRAIPAHEWAVLAVGLTQRARAIEAYLRDAYGRAEIVRDGAMAPEVITGCSAWRPEGRLLPDDVVRAPVIGFDLVRDAIGGWRVLEDNARVPSGVGYALAIRRLMHEVMPELFASAPMRNAEDALALIGRTLRGCSPVSDATVALLSEGADNSGWFEHRLIAEEVGLLLAQPSEVEVKGDRVVIGGRRVDVVYLRLGCELIDLVDVGGRPVGAQLLDAAQQGNVVVVNAPGNGIADDKAMYCYVPDLIAYYLGERPLLAPVPTYRCADPSERAVVLDRLDALVTKPVGGYGGSGVLIGPEASRSELSRRSKEIMADPGAWVAQEVVALSTLPTLVDGRLEPRHVDLRAFVYLTVTGAGEAELAGLALTRVAPAGSMVVNSSRGGGAKDTWVLLDDDLGGGGEHVRSRR